MMKLFAFLKSNVLTAFSSRRHVFVGVWFAATAVVAGFSLEAFLGGMFRGPYDEGMSAVISPGLWSSVMIPCYIAAFFSGAVQTKRFGAESSWRGAFRGALAVTCVATAFGLLCLFVLLSFARFIDALAHGDFMGSVEVFASLPIFLFLLGGASLLWTLPVGGISGVVLFASFRSGRPGGMLAGFLSFIFLASALLFASYERSRAGRLPVDTPRIAKSRPVGSPCGPKDSASAKRADSHPLGPTGGWSSIFSYEPARTKDLAESAITFFDGAYTGFLRLPGSGTVKIRAYDNVYGAVYCGWSPRSFHVDASDRAVFFRLGTCSVGDGGVETVHEICWFPDGQEEGRLILSSGHSSSIGAPLEPADIFVEAMKSELGTSWSSLSSDVILSFAKQGNLPEAQRLARLALQNFKSQPSAVEWSTKRPVPPEELRADEWVSLLSLDIASNIAVGDFPAAEEQLERLRVFAGTALKFCHSCAEIERMIPLFRWVLEVERNMKGGAPRPALPKVESTHIYAHNPVDMVKVLTQPASVPFSHSQHAEYEFWIGYRLLLDGDRNAAASSLEKFLASSTVRNHPFEAIIAAKHLRTDEHG